MLFTLAYVAFNMPITYKLWSRIFERPSADSIPYIPVGTARHVDPKATHKLFSRSLVGKSRSFFSLSLTLLLLSACRPKVTQSDENSHYMCFVRLSSFSRSTILANCLSIIIYNSAILLVIRIIWAKNYRNIPRLKLNTVGLIFSGTQCISLHSYFSARLQEKFRSHSLCFVFATTRSHFHLGF